MSSAVCPTWIPSGDPWSPRSPNKRPSHGRPAARPTATGSQVLCARRPPPRTTKTAAFVCANPHAEVVEALRWARALMASGVPAAEIGIAALSPDVWDKSMLVLSRTAGLPVHFTHGVAALESADGQACAALADVLLRGLSQVRVRRLLRRSPVARANLPGDWSRGLHRSAGLFTLTQWTTALEAGAAWRESGEAAEQALLPKLAQLAEGVAAADAAGEALLHSGRAGALARGAPRRAGRSAGDQPSTPAHSRSHIARRRRELGSGVALGGRAAGARATPRPHRAGLAQTEHGGSAATRSCAEALAP